MSPWLFHVYQQAAGGAEVVTTVKAAASWDVVHAVCLGGCMRLLQRELDGGGA